MEVRRVPYDIEAELAAIDRAGLPLSEGMRKLMRAGARGQSAHKEWPTTRELAVSTPPYKQLFGGWCR